MDLDTSSSTNRCFLPSVPELRNDTSSDLDSVKIEIKLNGKNGKKNKV